MNVLETMEKKEEVKIFDNEQFGQIRTAVIDGEPWFVAQDVYDILGLGNPSQALSRLEADEQNTIISNEGIGNPNKSIISESGLYTLVLSSRKPVGKPFRLWVTREVLPAIRKTGSYALPQPNGFTTMIEDIDCRIQIVYAQMNNVEHLLVEYGKKLDQVVDNMTLTTRQQQRIYKTAKDCVNHLLGGAHSKEYKAHSKSYFINLWNGLKSKFGCGSSYKDLNPIYFEGAMEFVEN